MNLKKKIATTSSLRHQVNLQKNVLLKKNNVIKYLIRGVKFHNGRSSRTGSITTRHKGGGCKKIYIYYRYLKIPIFLYA